MRNPPPVPSSGVTRGPDSSRGSRRRREGHRAKRRPGATFDRSEGDATTLDQVGPSDRAGMLLGSPQAGGEPGQAPAALLRVGDVAELPALVEVRLKWAIEA